MQDLYKNIEEYHISRKRKILIVFDDMIADLINNKKFKHLFLRRSASGYL